jgi:hypothetical protein
MHCHFLVCHSYVMNSFPCHLITLKVIPVANIISFSLPVRSFYVLSMATRYGLFIGAGLVGA